jgi:hypothetical protein
VGGDALTGGLGDARMRGCEDERAIAASVQQQSLAVGNQSVVWEVMATMGTRPLGDRGGCLVWMTGCFQRTRVV